MCIRDRISSDACVPPATIDGSSRVTGSDRELSAPLTLFTISGGTASPCSAVPVCSGRVWSTGHARRYCDPVVTPSYVFPAAAATNGFQ